MAGKNDPLLLLGLAGLGAVGAWFLLGRAKQEYPAQIPLLEGWNTVVYYGKSAPTTTALASIMDYVLTVWYFDSASQQYFVYDPADPEGSDLEYINFKSLLQVKVSQDCWWVFP